MSRILKIDMASSLGWVALGDDLKTIRLGPLKSHLAIDLIEELLQAHQVIPKQLEAVAVGIGPGSYTGLRVAASWAQGLALGCGVPLLTFCSLTAFASESEGRFLVAFDARGGGAFTREGRKVGSAVHWEGEPMRCSLDQLQEKASATGCLISPDLSLQSRLSLPPEVVCLDVVPMPKIIQIQGIKQRHVGSLDLLYLGSSV